MPSRSEINRYLWRRQFRTLLIGGVLLAALGILFRVLSVQEDKIVFLLSAGTTLMVVGALGFGVMALLRKRDS